MTDTTAKRRGGPVPRNPEERFWSHVDKTESCWLWTKALNSSGYAFFKYNGKMILGHRMAWEFTRGAISEGLVIDHKCRVRSCVNPDHLQSVTRQANAENIDPHPESNRTGHLNVYKRSNAFGYMVIVRSGGKRHYGGSFADLEDAAESARQLRNSLKVNNLQDGRG